MSEAPSPAEPPLLAPWIGTSAGRPALFYADAHGRTVIVPVDELALARLALSIAQAQSRLAAERLEHLGAPALNI